MGPNGFTTAAGTFSGTGFAGNGAGITNLSASAIATNTPSAGSLLTSPDGTNNMYTRALYYNAATNILGSTNQNAGLNFPGTNTLGTLNVPGVATLLNPSNQFAGNGAGLTSVFVEIPFMGAANQIAPVTSWFTSSGGHAAQGLGGGGMFASVPIHQYYGLSGFRVHLVTLSTNSNFTGAIWLLIQTNSVGGGFGRYLDNSGTISGPAAAGVTNQIVTDQYFTVPYGIMTNMVQAEFEFVNTMPATTNCQFLFGSSYFPKP